MPDILLHVTGTPCRTEKNPLATLVSHTFIDNYWQAMWILEAGSFLLSSALF